MKKVLFSGILALLCLSSVFAQSKAAIRILNNTGYTVHYVYLSQTASDSWGDDLLGTQVLQNGQYVEVVLPYPLNVVNRYDIKLQDLDGDTYTKWDVPVSQNAQIDFRFSDIDSSTPAQAVNAGSNLPTIRVMNNTGYTVYYVCVSQTASDSWGSNVLGSSVLNSGYYLEVTLPYALNVVNRYDIRLVDSDGDTYTNWNVLVTSGGQIDFRIGDLD
jgi:hypothetical protein